MCAYPLTAPLATRVLRRVSADPYHRNAVGNRLCRNDTTMLPDQNLLNVLSSELLSIEKKHYSSTLFATVKVKPIFIRVFVRDSPASALKCYDSNFTFSTIRLDKIEVWRVQVPTVPSDHVERLAILALTCSFPYPQFRWNAFKKITTS